MNTATLTTPLAEHNAFPTPSQDTVARLFAKHELRCTKQRAALYAALASTAAHPTADELYKHVSPNTDGLSLATVYNTLEKFCDVGLAQKLPGTNGFVRYDANTHSHLHVRCDKTGTVRDVPPALSSRFLNNLDKEILAEIEKHLGYAIEHVNIELIGDCGCGGHPPIPSTAAPASPPGNS